LDIVSEHKKPFMLKRISLYFWILISLSCSSYLHGQDVTSSVPPSPTAASLGVFGEIPVSEYSGVPDIRVPLFDVKVHDFVLPIALGYHAAGFSGDQEASWVGLNWALNAGGVITRSMRHNDDLITNGFYTVDPSSRPCGDTYDQEPDIFYYNIGSKVGKFYLDYASGGSTYNVRFFTKDNIKTYIKNKYNQRNNYIIIIFSYSEQYSGSI